MPRPGYLVIFVLLLGLPGSAGAAAPRAGIAGRVQEGPTCPVETVPQQPRCAPRPLQARVRISPADRHGKPRVVRSGADGRFRIVLAPGTYTVRGLPTGRSGLPRPPAAQRVRVQPGHFAHVTITYDTGIR